MERLSNSLRFSEGIRFHLLYGLGVNDSFITTNLKEIDFQNAVLKVLKKNSFQRVVFISPTQPIYFLDEESRSLSENILWGKRDQVLRSGKIDEIQSGPFGSKILLQKKQTENMGNEIGDVHGIRMIDAMMHENAEIRTCIVIRQTETLFRYFSDQRTLFGLIAEWFNLPTVNNNICVMDFGSANQAELIEQTKDIPFPQLKSLISSNYPAHSFNTNSYLHQIPGPDKKEISRLIQFASREKITLINEPDFERLVDWISSEGETNNKWLARFASIPELNLQSAKNQGWFSSSHLDPRSIEEKLDDLVGLDEIKKRIIEMTGYFAAKKKSKNQAQNQLLHLVFTGNPGTGKTTVARIMGDIYHEIGVLSRGHVVEAKAADLVAEHIGGTAIKTNKIIDEALEGILFIDEAYALAGKDRGGFGAEAMETLLTRMEDDRSQFVVILAGYTDQINLLLRTNPGLSRRFPVDNRFNFPDFEPTDLFIILKKMLSQRGLIIENDTNKILTTLVNNIFLSRAENFGNAGEVRNLADSLERKCLNRVHSSGIKQDLIITIDDISPEYQSYLQNPITNLDELLLEIDALMGLAQVKRYITRLARRLQFEQVRIELGKKSSNTTLIQNLVFMGNPGTGKTTVARLLGKIYKSLGLLRKGQFVEVTASDLIAGYVGQTSTKTLDIIKNAVDGVLFIDEAYALSRTSLSNNLSYGQEVIDTLIKAMDMYRGKLLIITAGYPAEMDQFMNGNPGLRSRFLDPILFPDFSSSEFGQILEQLCREDDFILPESVKIRFIETLEYQKSINPRGFGNARDVKKLYELMKDHLSERVILNSKKIGNNLLSFPPGWNLFTLEDLVEETDFPIIYDLPSSEYGPTPMNKQQSNPYIKRKNQ